MIRSLLAVLLIVGLTAGPALAGPRKVLVLPLDGTAEPATRTKLSASLQKMARVLDGEVTAGDATFNDTATAIGCDPTKPDCAESVRATLAVDELVYGTADEDAGQVTLVVKRSMKGKQPREVSRSFPASTPSQKVEVELLPVFSSEPLPDPATDPTVDPDPAVDPPTGSEPVAPPTPAVSRRERNVSIAITAGGGVLLVLGFSLWSSKAGLQDDIDNHPTTTREDIEELQELEDQASSRAWAGNFFVVAGLAVAAYGGWRLYRDHQEHKQKLTITPVPVEGGAAVILRGVL
ncbi:MAG: hypothetical protein M3680_23695 [Myxococcota bacterium]|nr:hypothetical protein [Myxococcota bacterium]